MSIYRDLGVSAVTYRTPQPVRIVEEILDWQPPPPQLIQRMREGTAELAELGIEAMDD